MMAYLLALGSGLLYGAADFIGGLTTRRAGVIPVVLISQASGLVLVTLLIPMVSPFAPATPDLLWGAAAGITGGIGVALLYRALAIGVMAVVAPTTAVCAVAIPVLVAVLLGERPVPLAVGGIVLGIASIVLVSQQHAGNTPTSGGGGGGSAVSRSTGVGIALVSGIAIGFFLLCLAQARADAGLWPLVASRSLSVLLFGAIAVLGRHSLRMPRSAWYLAIVCGAVDMLANALYLLAAREGPLSLVVTLTSLYPASTVLLARVVLGERLNGWQVTGVGCALAAVVMIVSGGR
jgi:drug/metabolite transporter (DMT)-like permease